MVVRLIALQVQDGQVRLSLISKSLIISIFQDFCGLEHIVGGTVVSTQERIESMIINLIMPLCLRVGSGRKGTLHQILRFVVTNAKLDFNLKMCLELSRLMWVLPSVLFFARSVHPPSKPALRSLHRTQKAGIRRLFSVQEKRKVWNE